MKLAEKVNTPTDSLIDGLSKTLADRDEKLLAEISKAVSKSANRIPAVAKGDECADWSIGEWFTLVGKAGSLDHGTAKNAQQMLGNKYKSFKTIDADGVKTNMTQGTGSQGGYLVPQRWLDSLLGIGTGYDYPLFPSRATILPVEKGTALNVPVGDYSVVPNGTEAPEQLTLNGVTVGFL